MQRSALLLVLCASCQPQTEQHETVFAAETPDVESRFEVSETTDQALRILRREEDPPATSRPIRNSEVLAAQAAVFAAQAALRRAEFASETQTFELGQAREFREFMQRMAKRGYRTYAEYSDAVDSAAIARFNREAGLEQVKERAAELATKKIALAELEGKESSYYEHCALFETIWRARCEQHKRRLRIAEIIQLAAEEDHAFQQRLHRKGYSNTATMEIVTFERDKARNGVTLAQDAHKLCLLQAEQFLRMREEQQQP